ncbi:MAG: CoA transferase [Tepidiformaceae bacterium]
MNEAVLDGIIVLAMEQAVALPFATRHLADLGAEVIRVQSHKRREGGLGQIDLTRNKRQLAIDFAAPGGPEAFLRVAAKADIVAHNYTPRVVRRFGIDYERVKAVNPSVIYLSLTGFGTSGPWGERPLFGPGSEAVSGHNLLIGDPDGWPGRPGTIVYADATCGLNAVFAILAALDHRDRTGEGQHIDISLYETQVAQLGTVLAERQLGAEPSRCANHEANYVLHGVFECIGPDRHVAVAVTADQAPAAAAALGLPELTDTTFAAAVRGQSALDIAARLQAFGVPATAVADASDIATDDHLWARRYFALVARQLPGYEGTFPHMGPAWGGGPAVPGKESHSVGSDSAEILRDVAGYSEKEVRALFEAETVGELTPIAGSRPSESSEIRVERGELSRVEPNFGRWKDAAARAGRAE